MSSRSIAAIAVCAGLVCGACTTGGGPAPGGSAPAPGGAGLPAARVGQPFVLVGGLAVPWAIAFLPGGDALVPEHDSARLLRVTPRGGVSTVGTVPGAEPFGEGGLLGVAVSPSFARDRQVYPHVSPPPANPIVRVHSPGRGVRPLRPRDNGHPPAPAPHRRP